MKDLKSILKTIEDSKAKLARTVEELKKNQTELDQANAELEKLLEKRLDYNEAAVVGDTVYICTSGGVQSYRKVELA